MRNPSRATGDHDSRALRCAPASGPVVNRCCGRDLGPLHDDEGPSEDDIRRFSGVTQSCPACRAELYDDAEICWSCGHALGAPSGRPGWRTGVVVAVTVVAFAAVLIVRSF